MQRRKAEIKGLLQENAGKHFANKAETNGLELERSILQ
jgi:hypothetical protein